MRRALIACLTTISLLACDGGSDPDAGPPDSGSAFDAGAADAGAADAGLTCDPPGASCVNPLDCCTMRCSVSAGSSPICD